MLTVLRAGTLVALIATSADAFGVAPMSGGMIRSVRLSAPRLRMSGQPDTGRGSVGVLILIVTLLYIRSAACFPHHS